MTDARPMLVLVVGSTGQTGRRVVAAATRHALHLRALARDVERAWTILPDVDIVQSDLEKPDTLVAAVQDVDAIVFAHGADSGGGSGSFERVDYGGVANTLRALGGRPVRIALMTSINVTRRDSAYRELLDWKRRSERLVRASGCPYTIVRPGWFDMTRRGDQRLVPEQGDTGSGAVGRDQVAEVLIRSLLTDAAQGKTFELFATTGEAPADWNGLFASAAPDPPNALDGVKDPDNLPLDTEPASVRRDIEQIRVR
jgi:uncharacterized protein YbjT (DUF2867 family)